MKHIYTLLAVFLFFASCEREAFDYTKNQNNDVIDDSKLPDVEVGLSNILLSIDKSLTSRSSNEELDNYIIRIHNAVTKDTLSWFYKELPSLITLKPRSYVIEAFSHIPLNAAFEAPLYGASKAFEVAENKVTEIGELTCKLSSILVSVELDEKLTSYIKEDARVVIRVGKGELTYLWNEKRIGSFLPSTESNTLTAELYATTLSGKVLELSGKSFTNVKAGEHRTVKFILNETETKPDEGILSQVAVTVDATCERVDEDVVVNPGDETLLPEEPVNPDPTDDAPVIEGVGFDISQAIQVPIEGLEVKVAMASKIGFTHLFVTIDSETLTEELLTDVGLAKTFDLAYPGQLESALQDLGFPTGSSVIGQTQITFDITSFTPLLGIYGAANHHFIIKAVDANGETTKTLTLISE
ncbi:MAG: DUF4493 domain-containing protein [Phocaeicola sp.]